MSLVPLKVGAKASMIRPSTKTDSSDRPQVTMAPNRPPTIGVRITEPKMEIGNSWPPIRPATGPIAARIMA
ncbi:hypothetical protein D3C72_2142040 [compost metagenome]